MNSKTSFLLTIIFLILCPVLSIFEHDINLAEFYIYLAFVINLKRIEKNPISTAFLVYAVLFLVTIITTSTIAGQSINNHDIFIIRNCLQLSMAFSLFQTYLKTIDRDDKFILRCCIILTIPALLIFLQKINLLSARELIIYLYRPKFHYLGAETFTDFRYTSVFKDFFTAACFFITSTCFMYYLYLSHPLKKRSKLILLCLIAINLLAQFFVARTGLVLIPISILLMAVLISPQNIIQTFKRLTIIILLATGLLLFLIPVLIQKNIINSSWSLEAWQFFIFDSTTTNQATQFSSFAVMQKWNANFFANIFQNPDFLFRPHHTYDLVEAVNPFLYTDSFYAQEIYRYGIYGIFTYLVLIIQLFRNFFKSSRFLLLLLLLFVVLNYKGGNVFFMPKNIYLYALVFAMIIGNENKKKFVL